MRPADRLLPLAPGLLVVALSFEAGGFFPGATAAAAVALVVLLVFHVTLAERPFAGLSLLFLIGAVALGLLALWTLISAWWSEAPARALLEYDRALLYLLAFVALGLAGRTPARLRLALRSIAVALWLAAMLALGLVRALLAGLDARRWLRGTGTRRTLIVGAGQVSRAAARRFVERPGLGLEPVGFLDLNPLEGDERDPLVLGASWDLDRVVDEHRIGSVLIGFSSAPHHVILRTVHRCWDLGLEVMVVPRLFEVQGLRSRTRHVGALPLVSLERSSHEGPSLSFKEAFDRVVASLILIGLSPVLAVIAFLVNMTSDGPVLHRAVRIGQDGRSFDMLKFRTMLGNPEERGETHADWAAESLRGVDGSTGAVALLSPPAAAGQEPHTPIGRFLRRTALDELPQLWNVARGEMALVGPRPELASFAPLLRSIVTTSVTASARA